MGHCGPEPLQVYQTTRVHRIYVRHLLQKKQSNKTKQSIYFGPLLSLIFTSWEIKSQNSKLRFDGGKNAILIHGRHILILSNCLTQASILMLHVDSEKIIFTRLCPSFELSKSFRLWFLIVIIQTATSSGFSHFHKIHISIKFYII